MKLRPYQLDGVNFIHNTGCKALLADEMGLGKTIQAIEVLRTASYPVFPCLVVVPASLTTKWQREFKQWLLTDPRFKSISYAPLIHNNSSGYLIPGFQIHIISNAILVKLVPAILEYGFQTVIIDEAHQYKNDGANRTWAFKKLCSAIPRKLLLTGTPIANHAMEYFNLLQAIRPQEWQSKAWLEQYCIYGPNGKPLSLSKYAKERFFTKIKPYVLRRTKSEVLGELPEKEVRYEFLSLQSNINFVNAYNKQLDELEAILDKHKCKLASTVELIAVMQRLRHIVGISKTRFIADLALELLECNINQKLCIGVYHKLVAEQLASLLSIHNPLLLGANSNKDEVLAKFRSPKHRLCIASTRASSLGLDIEFCQNVFVAERDWNRSLENQFEDRFHRIGTQNKVFIQYWMTSETIDEFFHELVQLKAAITSSFLDYNYETDNNFIAALAERAVMKRLKYV